MNNILKLKIDLKKSGFFNINMGELAESVK